MYVVQVAYVRTVNTKIIDRIVSDISKKMWFSCKTVEDVDFGMTRVLLDKEFESADEARKVAWMVYSICGIPSLVRRSL